LGGPHRAARMPSPGKSLPAGRAGNVCADPKCRKPLVGRQKRWCSEHRRASGRDRANVDKVRTVLGRREPTYRLVPDQVSGSRAREAIDLATSAGLHLDEWQEDVLVDGMALNGKGWAADEVVAVLPGQNGKTIDLVIRALWGPTMGGEKLVLFTAHEFKTCREAFLLAKGLCETEALERFGPKVSISHGKEGISFERAPSPVHRPVADVRAGV
jgi:hypothetical protein